MTMTTPRRVNETAARVSRHALDLAAAIRERDDAWAASRSNKRHELHHVLRRRLELAEARVRELEAS